MPTADYAAFNQFFAANWSWFVPFLVWTVAWKGLALWKAARRHDKAWFIALLVINTGGALDILYYFIFSKRGLKENTRPPANPHHLA